MNQDQTRSYDRASSIVFLKTNERFGGLSNMAGGYPLLVNGVRILTSEALYQACRFPHLADVQRLIIGERSPMTAKMKSKPYRQDSRPDWDRVRVRIMRWCLRVKLAQNWRAFSELLLESGEQSIVEESWKDDFWGAKPMDNCTLVGMNVLGRLLMELREAVKAEGRDALLRVQPLAIPDFLLVGQLIVTITAPDTELAATTTQPMTYAPSGDVDSGSLAQQLLFDASAINEAPPPAYLDVKEKVVVVADLKPYADYKESWLPWLGQVPRHWDLVPNRGLVRKRKVLVGDRHGNYPLLSLTKQGVIVRDISTGKGKFSADMGTSQEVRNGDLVFCLFDVPETPRTVGLSSHDGMITGAYTVFESLGKGSSEYFELFYTAMDDRKLLSPLYSGLRNTIPPERFLGTKTPQPPRAEQVAIVQYLGWVNGRLERAIRAKRKVIGLLNEQKQAIIQRAVTRGLDTSVSLKPSGIPWLGEIPQHWEVRRLRHLIKGRLTYGANAAAEFTNPEWPRYIRITDFRVDGSLKTDTFRSLPPTIACDYMVAPGDILLARSGATVGKAFLVVELTGAACHAGYLIRARPDRRLVAPGFLFAFTQSKAFSAWKDSTFNTATIQNIGADKYADLHIPFPPLSEQRVILDSVAVEHAPLLATISRLEREIELLREYRTRLVADVVTGKLDVREAVAQLPDETAPAIAEDDDNLSDDIEPADEEAAA